ncbi:hypothetical protein DFP78_107181 [Photobacterium lutimaris]|nr:hypothetical protein DFP78_107181 [Photobacterium lutimaris]
MQPEFNGGYYTSPDAQKCDIYQSSSRKSGAETRVCNKMIIGVNKYLKASFCLYFDSLPS